MKKNKSVRFMLEQPSLENRNTSLKKGNTSRTDGGDSDGSSPTPDNPGAIGVRCILYDCVCCNYNITQNRNNNNVTKKNKNKK